MSSSRSQTPASASSGPSGRHVSASSGQRYGSDSTAASAPRSTETDQTVEDGDNGRRRHRQGTSAGGFLLDSLAAHPRGSPKAGRYDSLKGKRRAEQERKESPQRQSLHAYSQPVESSPTAESLGGEEDDTQGSQVGPGARVRPVSHNPYMTQNRRHDPVQLVNIALQLNQTRQRQASAHFRPNAAGAGSPGRALPGSSPVAVGASPGRDIARHSPFAEQQPATGAVIANALSPQQQDTIRNESYTDANGPTPLDFFPSPQTINRAARAKIALELKYHHRRILQHLPRLPAAQSFISGPGRAALNNDPANSVPFGREFNPLQYARNRRIRMQRRCPLDPEKDGWDDVDRVRVWVDEVAAQRHVQLSSLFDNYALPHYARDGSQILTASKSTIVDANRPRAGTRLPLPPKDWTASAADMLADIYWLQEEDNRRLVEDCNGDKLFPPEATLQATNGDDRRRSIFDSERRSSSNPRQAADSGRGSLDGRLYGPRNPSPEKKVGDPTTTGSPRTGAQRRGLVASQFSKRVGRRSSMSSSEDEKRERRKSSRPWKKTFSKHWEGPTMPKRVSAEQLQQTKEARKTARASLDAHSRNSHEIRRPFSIELHPPQEDKQTSPTKIDTFSDTDSTAPNSPVQVPTVPSLAADFDHEKIFGSSQKRSKDRNSSDRHHEVELRDFAEDPFRSDDRGFITMKMPSKAHTTTLSSPSETSFSAGSDGKSRPKLRRRETERVASKSPEESSFRVPKPWKAGKYVAGRVGDLLRRKDYASDTSETDDDFRRNGLKLQTTNATTSSTDRGTLSRSSTLSRVGESPGYRPPEMPKFSPLRREGATGSPSRIKTSETISQRLSRDAATNEMLSPASIGVKSPSRSLTPQLSRMASTEGSEHDVASRKASAQKTGGGSGRRGATATDVAGHQWPLPNRSNADPWPGEDTDALDKALWAGPELLPTKTDQVTEADIFRTEAILQGVCVKAANAAQKFRSVPSMPGPLLVEARQKYDPDHPSVTKLEEPRVLYHQLTKQIESHVEGLNQAAYTLINDDITRVDSQLDGIKLIVQDKLTGMVLVAGDNADGLGHELSAGLTREIRDLNDSIDQILRARRRRNRLLRRALFQILEWIIMAVMWGLWLLVVSFKAVKGTFRLVSAVIRWLFLL